MVQRAPLSNAATIEVACDEMQSLHAIHSVSATHPGGHKFETVELAGRLEYSVLVGWIDVKLAHITIYNRKSELARCGGSVAIPVAIHCRPTRPFDWSAHLLSELFDRRS
jgi:hypothetical protein